MIKYTEHQPNLNAIKRRVRLVIILDAVEKAGFVPLTIRRFHTIAYLSNVLAPVWNIRPLDGKVLKRHGNPFYPELQQDLDRLVGMGVVLISELSHVQNEEGQWRLEGSYRLNQPLAKPILDGIKQFYFGSSVSGFIQELAFALSALSDDELDMATNQDATYADPIVDVGSVVDFGEWKEANPSATAARSFKWFSNETSITNGEMLHFYMHHLQERLKNER